MSTSRRRRALTSLAIGVLFLEGSARAVPVISDTELANSNWSAVLLGDNTVGGVTFTATQVATGGNPGAFREITHVYTGPGGFNIGHFYESASYDPAVSGALQSINISFDDAFFNYPGQGGTPPGAVAIFPAIRQGGKVFDGFYSVTTSSAWVHQEFDNLTASDFGGADFSSAGAPIFFGFVSGNGSAFGGQTTTISGVDNFSVSVTLLSVPEPASFALLAFGLVALALPRHRSPIAPTVPASQTRSRG